MAPSENEFDIPGIGDFIGNPGSCVKRKEGSRCRSLSTGKGTWRASWPARSSRRQQGFKPSACPVIQKLLILKRCPVLAKFITRKNFLFMPL